MTNPHIHVAAARWSNRQFARDSSSQHGTIIHFQKCYSTMQELFDAKDRFNIRVGSHDSIRFLDIACAPGGFSQYLLDKYPHSEGFGITLPKSHGGFPLAIHAHPPSRFKVCYFDLLAPPMHPVPSLGNLVDLVIGDAQYFPRSQEASDSYIGRMACTVTGGRLGLLLREFIIALESLQSGGVFIFRFVGWEKIHANILRLFYLCFDLFESVKPFKSEYQHTADCTFYAVCSNFNRNKYIELDIGTHLRISYARVIQSPAFGAVHNGTINCFKVINDQHSKQEFTTDRDAVLDKPDAHILEKLYAFKDMKNHPYFKETCDMFEYVYKMFLVGQSSYTDHYRVL
jgi:23S rRNA U2552 (ribose-2'-O)-methylase RlmE/FtsJ